MSLWERNDFVFKYFYRVPHVFPSIFAHLESSTFISSLIISVPLFIWVLDSVLFIQTRLQPVFKIGGFRNKNLWDEHVESNLWDEHVESNLYSKPFLYFFVKPMHRILILSFITRHINPHSHLWSQWKPIHLPVCMSVAHHLQIFWQRKDSTMPRVSPYPSFVL